MWAKGWREALWSQLDQAWDVLVIGGGITGAGILREATRLGLRVLLVEQRDFAWGTSSRSSKLVHGGLRYLATGQPGLTWASVREREHLLHDAPGLIDPMGFLIATHKGDKPGRLMYGAGLAIYDLMALQWSHRYYSADEFLRLAPQIAAKNLQGGFRYEDAQTDDARLVLRVIREAVADGGAALNYAHVEDLLLTDGKVTGVRVRDTLTEQSAEIRARVVFNATGAYADGLRRRVGGADLIRPLRGSHLIFPAARLPLAQAVTFLHPLDRRPVFAFPWEGVTLVGTTDVDHPHPGDEPEISADEVAYLMAAVTDQFPACNLTLDDVIATYAGVRPVIGTGKDDPSKESREHVVMNENGLITVTGGKLTTFRVIALDALKAAQPRLPGGVSGSADAPVLNAVDADLPEIAGLDDALRRRLIGRYGADALALMAAAEDGELALIPGCNAVWAELRWAARAEGVAHLDDLLLRRVRLGLLLPEGGAALLAQIRAICQPELGWDDARWEQEEARYRALWRAHYSLPDRALIPDWFVMLAEARQNQPETAAGRNRAMSLVFFLLLITLCILVCGRRRSQTSAG